MVIEGKLEGDLEVADKLEIRSAATLLGDLRTARIRIDDGGCFKGNIDILSPETEGATMVAGQAPALRQKLVKFRSSIPALR